MTYVPSHLQYILKELLKNAVVAVHEAQRANNFQSAVEACDVRVEVSQCDQMLSFLIQDAAGGLPPPAAWSFGYSNWRAKKKDTEKCRPPVRQNSFTTSNNAHWNKRVAGGGVGLPLVRVYSEFLGGSVSTVQSTAADDAEEREDHTKTGILVQLPISESAEEVSHEARMQTLQDKLDGQMHES